MGSPSLGPRITLGSMPGLSRPIYPGDRRRQRPEGEIVAQAQAVFPAGRATSVPFTAVMTGPQRTPTDNTSAASPGPFPDRGAAGRADRASLGENPKATHGGNVIGRALASSAC